MTHLLAGLLTMFIVTTVAAQEDKRINVWLDVDPANGVGEIDDGVMMLQAFHSPELKVRGVSIVFGNAPLRYAINAGYNVVKTFGPEGMEVHSGAASGEDFGKENDAVRAMAAALREAPMTIVAVGPVTNVGTLVKLHPELNERIESIIVVAGRRPGQKFITTQASRATYPRDFNFESDVPAMQAILDTNIKFVMAPWEVSSKVWITREDIESLRSRSLAGEYLYLTSQHWLRSWETRRGVAAFNPYDTLAVGWLTHPQLIEGALVDVSIEIGADERATQEERAAGATKPYLLMHERKEPTRPAIYLHTPKLGFKPMLLDRVAGPASDPARAQLDKQPAATFSHVDFDLVLKQFVDEKGLVNYAALNAQSLQLQEYISELAAVDLDSMNEKEQLALLINAYNAFTLQLILEHYPVTSIKDIAEGDRWKARRWHVGKHVWSLDDIEHEQIRKRFAEPRIHFALVCAGLSCPPLRGEAYTAARLEEQLEDQTRHVHTHDEWLRFDAKANVLHLTPLYKWYGGDFEKHEAPILEYIARYVPAVKAKLAAGDPPKIEWLDYDWSLNSPKAE